VKALCAKTRERGTSQFCGSAATGGRVHDGEETVHGCCVTVRYAGR
jgi:hypothetical protein